MTDHHRPDDADPAYAGLLDDLSADAAGEHDPRPRPSDPAYAGLLDDLEAEHQALDAVVGDLDDPDWDRPTPAQGWTVRDQIGHLWWFDEAAWQSAVDPERFRAARDALIADYERVDDITLGWARSAPAAELLASWRRGRAALLDALSRLEPSARLEWYGPPMGAMSFATARLMETWAHGQDVVDALGASRPATDRLRHIAHLGVRTRGFSYTVRGLDVPEGEVRVELDPPGGGEPWTWGDAGASDRVTGPAEDFCLVVTQRRNVADTALAAEGSLATGWLEVAQAFAGGAGGGRAPGSFPRG